MARGTRAATTDPKANTRMMKPPTRAIIIIMPNSSLTAFSIATLPEVPPSIETSKPVPAMPSLASPTASMIGATRSSKSSVSAGSNTRRATSTCLSADTIPSAPVS